MSDEAPDYVLTVDGLDDALLEIGHHREADILALNTDVHTLMRYGDTWILEVQILPIPIGKIQLALTDGGARCLHAALGHMIEQENNQ